MITVKSAKQTLTGNFEINGYCLMEDEKPVENVANGSKLWELNTGNNYVFDEENGEWIKIKKNSGSGVTTRTYTGTLDTLFDIDHIKEYYEISNNDAIGIMTSENIPGVNMALNYYTTDTTMTVIAGANMEGMGYADLLDNISVLDYPYQADDSNGLIRMVESTFAAEAGFNIIITIDTSNNEFNFLFRFCYINTNGTPSIISIDNTNTIQNLGNFTLTFYYMNNIQPTITKETLSGPLSTIFSNNNYTEEQFNNLVQDVHDGKAFISIPLTFGTYSFAVPAMGIISSNDTSSLQFGAIGHVNGTVISMVIHYFWDVDGNNILTVVSTMQMLAPASNWQSIDESTFNILTGQSSYDFIITRISDAQ